MSIRRVLVAALAVTAMGLSSVRGQERIEIFDAHLHYNQEPTPFYTLIRCARFSAATGLSVLL